MTVSNDAIALSIVEALSFHLTTRKTPKIIETKNKIDIINAGI